MAANDEGYTNKIRAELLKKSGEFRTYFRAYDAIFQQGTGDHIVRIEGPASPDRRLLSHDAILMAASILRANSKLTPETAISELQKHVPQGHQEGELKFVVNVAIHAVLMLDANLIDLLTLDYSVRKYRRPS